ncbi:MAG TPA: 50S ribosomal protein L25 [Verrucomicrobiales bacterium]|nr:50S ribosomal protein L25 [Verrucomicrobiae bacterium]MCP5554323.1 50S ribosomal protein L25 [Akkermansiaceae bacterium]HRX54070.1 50S ribosomal protein L25 [Verrucomicrobiales bacterium]
MGDFSFQWSRENGAGSGEVFFFRDLPTHLTNSIIQADTSSTSTGTIGMATYLSIKAQKRESSGTSTAKKLRRQGIVPAVVYGSKQDNYGIQVDAREFGEVLRHQTSINFLLNLEIEGAREAKKLAMVQAVQRDPLSGAFVHIDFHAVKADEVIHAHIPVELIGDSAGVKLGGVMDHLIHSLEIHCLPSDLPERIEADVTSLEIGNSLHIRDLILPKGVTTPMDGGVVVALVAEPRA